MQQAQARTLRTGLLALLLGTRTLLGAKGIATRSKKLLGAPGLTTRNKKLLGARAQVGFSV